MTFENEYILYILLNPLGRIFFIIVLIAILSFLIYASACICSNVYVKVFCKADTDNKQIALTFDDGPSENTEEILDILKSHDAKATFFCIGSNIEKYPGKIKKMHEGDHIVSNHTYSHAHMIDVYPAKRLRKEIAKTNDLIASETGKEPLFFRPPYGVTNPSFKRALKSFPMKVIGWNIRSLDTVKSKEQVLTKIKKKLRPGSIVLLHDKANFEASLLTAILEHIKEQGYEIVSLDKLLNLKAYA